MKRLRHRRHRYRPSDDSETSSLHDDQFYNIGDLDTASLSSMEDRNVEPNFSNMREKQIFEDHMAQLQEQLVSIMIENQNLVQELKQYRDNKVNERNRQALKAERRNRDLHVHNQLGERKIRNDTQPQQGIEHGVEAIEGARARVDILPAEGEKQKSKFDRLWERTVDRLYDIVDDFSEVTKPVETRVEEGDPLSVKTLKENIKRFKLASKPYVDIAKGLNNLVSWKSTSYTFIVFCIYMYSVWRGWFIPFMIALVIIRMVVSYLHHKNFQFRFSYLDPGEPDKDSEDSLGLTDKFNLVLMVATKVQNGLGSAADGLEKIKNLLTWRHPEGTQRVFRILCFSFVCMVVLPTSVVWTCMGLGIGVKIFLVNHLYKKYPRLKKKYDSNMRLWNTLPTDAQYDKSYVKSQMDKYIVIPRDNTEIETAVDGHISDSDSSSDEGSRSSDFRQLFSLPPSECPLRGWVRGKRAVLVGKSRSLVTLISKKRGRLYLTKSFLCFEREKTPSVRNIVIPVQDIVSVDKVKMNQRFPGTGMAMQILIHGNGTDNVLIFGGIIGRDEVTKNVQQAMKDVKQSRRASPLQYRDDNVSKRSSTGSTSPRIQNFTFGSLYSDSE